jgi:hypothetical protein
VTDLRTDGNIWLNRAIETGEQGNCMLVCMLIISQADMRKIVPVWVTSVKLGRVKDQGIRNSTGGGAIHKNV